MALIPMHLWKFLTRSLAIYSSHVHPLAVWMACPCMLNGATTACQDFASTPPSRPIPITQDSRGTTVAETFSVSSIMSTTSVSHVSPGLDCIPRTLPLAFPSVGGALPLAGGGSVVPGPPPLRGALLPRSPQPSPPTPTLDHPPLAEPDAEPRAVVALPSPPSPSPPHVDPAHDVPDAAPSVALALPFSLSLSASASASLSPLPLRRRFQLPLPLPFPLPLPILPVVHFSAPKSLLTIHTLQDTVDTIHSTLG